MNPGPEKQYTLEQAATVSRWVTQFLTLPENARWFDEAGIFRLAGQQARTTQLISAILSNAIFNSDIYSRDDCIDAFKQVVRYSQLIPENDPDVVNLRSVIQEAEEDNLNLATQALQQFIDKCARSGDNKKIFVAEVLHNYLHLMHLAEKKHDINKMDASNLAIIIAPMILGKILQIANTNPMTEMHLNNKIKNICMPLIDGNQFDQSFYMKYSDEINDYIVDGLNEAIISARDIYTRYLRGQLASEHTTKAYMSSLEERNNSLQHLKEERDKENLKKSEFKSRKEQLSSDVKKLQLDVESSRNNAHAMMMELNNQKKIVRALEGQRERLVTMMGQVPPPELPLPTQAPIIHTTPIVRAAQAIPAEERPVFMDETFSETGSPLTVSSEDDTPSGSPSTSPGKSRDDTLTRRKSIQFSPAAAAASTGTTVVNPRLSLPNISHEGTHLASMTSALPAPIHDIFRSSLTDAIAEDPNKVIKILVTRLQEQFSPQVIGQLLYEHRNELAEHQAELGDILTKRHESDKDTPHPILTEYMKQFDFSNQEFGKALKQFLQEGGFRLPGESQNVYRAMVAFGTSFYNSNQSILTNQPGEDGASKYIKLAYATMMLNTSLHNPAAIKGTGKMKKEQFVTQVVRECNINDERFAKDLYKFIDKNEIKMPVQEMKGKTLAKKTR